MKRFVGFVAAIAAFGFVNAASAADMPVKAHPMVAPIYNWTGFYLGVNAGGVFGRSPIEMTASPSFFTSASLIGATGSPTLSSSGFTGGALAGFNWQSGNIVYGLETDFEYTDVNKSQSVTLGAVPGLPLGFTVSESIKSNWLWTLRPRLGVTLGTAMPSLLYVTGGLAVANVTFSQGTIFPNCPCAMNTSITKTQAGWTVGGGWELALSGPWTMRAEYLYVDLGNLSFNDNLGAFGFPTASFTHSAKLTEHIARLAVSYRFGR